MATDILHSGGKKNLLPLGFGSRPWLFQLNGTRKHASIFLDPINNHVEEKFIPEFQGKTCWGCYGEWMLLSDELTREFFFLSIISFSRISIAPFPNSPDFSPGTISITSPPDAANCMAIIACSFKTFLLVCSPGSKRWKRVHIKYLTENNYTLHGASAIYKTKLIALTTFGVTLAIDVASLVRGFVNMTVIDRLLTCPMLCYWSSYLVKCGGNLFSILLHSYLTAQIVTHVEVRQLEFFGKGSNKMRWRRVQDIGDHSFFLAGWRGRSLPANEACGAQRNCIYFSDDWSDGMRLYKFCLDDQILSFTFLTATAGILDMLQWAFPTKTMPTTAEVTSRSIEALRSTETAPSITSKDGENENIVISRKWDELPFDVVEMLFTRLSFVDCLRLPSVCKAWSEASTKKGQVLPWLMHLPTLGSRSCKFFDPFYCKEYTIKNDVLAASDHLALRFSKNGWVVVTEGNHRVFLLNPFTGQIFNLPSLEDEYIFEGISFLSVPTSRDFAVFGFFFNICGDFVEISKWRPGDEEWTTSEFQASIPFLPSFNNPVLFCGEFYCLGRKGELGVFNPELETWTVLSKPEPIYLMEPRYGDENCYLLELDGDLISVFKTDDTQKEIRAFKLDHSEMAWKKLEHLGDMTLFVDRRNSIAIPSPGKQYANKIYVTRWGGTDCKKGIFYSMEDHKYYPSVHSMEEPMNCVWMEPNLDVQFTNEI